MALGDPPCLGGWPLIKINSLHNNIVIVIVHKCLVNKEPALHVGETGWGKTTICQLLSIYMKLKLYTINMHQNTETSDFIGWMRA